MRSFHAGTYDIQDDGGMLLKRLVPDVDDIPDFVKTAEAVNQTSNSRLFALVMVDDGDVMKKFATADPGNTWLSALYFAFTKDDLPEEAQKVAAANLIEACDAFEIEAPEFLWDIADGPADTNIVDVTGLRPPAQIKVAAEKEETVYAIERADGSKYYPLKDASHVKAAMDYFDRNEKNFVPRERREYAVKVAHEAKKAAFRLSPSIEKYAGQGWNPALEGHITTRYMHLTDRDAGMDAKSELMKIASVRGQINPEDFAAELERFDLEHGLDALWDKEVADPWYSTLGFEKVAKGSHPPTTTYTIGEVSVTSEELHLLADRGFGTVSKNFGEDVAAAFAKNPIQIFESMPIEQRKLFARLATTHGDDRGMG